MCRRAMGNSASPHCRIMNPICATVDRQRGLDAGWVSMTRLPNSAVNPPINHQHARTTGACSMTSAKANEQEATGIDHARMQQGRNGGGRSMTFPFSQPWVGNCADFRMAASASKAAAVTLQEPPAPPGPPPGWRRFTRAEVSPRNQSGGNQSDISNAGDDEFCARPAALQCAADKTAAVVQQQVEADPAVTNCRSVPD